MPWRRRRKLIGTEPLCAKSSLLKTDRTSLKKRYGIVRESAAGGV